MEEFDHISDSSDAQGSTREHHLSAPSRSDDSRSDERGRGSRTTLNRPDPWKARLEYAIQAEVVPRLLASLAPHSSGRAHRPPAHAGAPATPPATPPATFRAPALKERLDEFVDLLLKTDAEDALAYVARLQAEGASGESICLDLLTPAARRLGAMWDEDSCDLMEVTVGVQILHRILRLLRPERASVAGTASSGKRILLVPAPGESHVFGAAIVEKFFQDARWDVMRAAEKAFLDDLKTGWFDVAGFSLSMDRNLEWLKNAIATARRQSANPKLRILVGGPVFLDDPGLVKAVGADAMAEDAPSAVLWAERLPDRNVIV